MTEGKAGIQEQTRRNDIVPAGTCHGIRPYKIDLCSPGFRFVAITVTTIISAEIQAVFVIDDNVELGIQVVEIEFHPFQLMFFRQERLDKQIHIRTAAGKDKRAFVLFNRTLQCEFGEKQAHTAIELIFF